MLQTSTSLTRELLENKTAFFDQLLTQPADRKTNLNMLLLTVGCLFSFGLIIGSNHSILQALSSAVKLPLLYLMTAAICFPTMYFFLAVFGVRCSAGQLLGFGMGTLTFMGLTLLAFAPVSLFTVITVTDYALLKLINVGIFSISGVAGIYLWIQHLRAQIAQMQNAQSRKNASVFLFLWLLMFALVGAQLSYALSPFFGYPEEPFMLFTPGPRDFFTDLIETLWQLS